MGKNEHAIFMQNSWTVMVSWSLTMKHRQLGCSERERPWALFRCSLFHGDQMHQGLPWMCYTSPTPCYLSIQYLSTWNVAGWQSGVETAPSPCLAWVCGSLLGLQSDTLNRAAGFFVGFPFLVSVAPQGATTHTWEPLLYTFTLE